MCLTSFRVCFTRWSVKKIENFVPKDQTPITINGINDVTDEISME